MLPTEVKNPPASFGQEMCWATWDETRKSNVIQTESEDGTIQVRRRFTGQWRACEVSVNVEEKKYKDFVNFFTVTVRDGVDGFWTKTPYGDIEAWRFASTPSISWSPGGKTFSIRATIVRDDAWPKK